MTTVIPCVHGASKNWVPTRLLWLLLLFPDRGGSCRMSSEFSPTDRQSSEPSSPTMTHSWAKRQVCTCVSRVHVEVCKGFFFGEGAGGLSCQDKLAFRDMEFFSVSTGSSQSFTCTSHPLDSASQNALACTAVHLSTFLVSLFAFHAVRLINVIPFITVVDGALKNCNNLSDVFAGNLTKADRELIVVATSIHNKCLYCVVSHGALHRIYSKKPTLSDQVSALQSFTTVGFFF